MIKTKNIIFLSCLILCICTGNILSAQKYLLRDDVYVDYIRSVEWGRKGAPLSLPHIDLGGNGVLRLAFDDMDDVDKTFRYEIIYCTKDWERSDLEEIQYFNGYNNEIIQDADASVGKYANYLHYELEIPNENVELTRSGNYLLIIYEDEYDKIPVITRRFMLVEPITNVYVDLIRPYKVDKLRTHQELDITINLKDIRVSNPLNEVSITIMQNGRWDNIQSNIKPRYNLGSDLKFNSPDLITFPASKEFRNFDIRTLDFTSINVHSIDLYRDGTDVLLDLAYPRSETAFIYNPDANGQFVIQKSRSAIQNPLFLDQDFVQNTLIAEFRSNEKNLDAEYANVIFSLKTPPQLGDVYVVGKFSDWLPRPEYRMEYDSNNEIYLVEAKFKQGYYDFMYALVSDTETEEFNISKLEGDWYETENEYTVFVYLSQFGAISDRLIAVTTIGSLIR